MQAAAYVAASAAVTRDQGEAPEGASAAAWGRIAETVAAVVASLPELDEAGRAEMAQLSHHARCMRGRHRKVHAVPGLAVLASEHIAVTRSAGGIPVRVAVSALEDPHIAVNAGGRGEVLPGPMVAARVSCAALPVGTPWHDCQHGPPPHRIRVLVDERHNDRRVFAHLRSVAERRRVETIDGYRKNRRKRNGGEG